MAKRKTPKVKDLRPEKITGDQLKTTQRIVSNINRLQMDIGNLESQKHNLLHELGLSQKKIVDMQGVFSKEYGSIDINVTDGTINRKKDEK